ncbi:type II secretion system protein [Mangrovibacillus cuniculi]|uniref:Prepilin-type N-terminal cleavage/methylation domain-containing protein n=1 Tax=Mangrovibacillus cuniculi TaxID=2593652 RepID=A0A7S8CBQ5_9BACI|nr:type II secretion system protein [Mangrovibacillus cuniculi]QPC47054.1 prepilin-type N-terminal cleavage/methylation domain-containing protein [Mangrovibacillus cuniculi]
MKKRLNEKGYTLVELLAVVVILGIIALIATIAIGGLLERAKKDALVANAIALKDAGTFYVKNHVGIEAPTKLTYKQLVDHGMLEPIKDPFTRETIESNENSYIVIEEERVTKVCFIGKTKNLCTVDGETSPIAVSNLSISAITDNTDE